MANRTILIGDPQGCADELEHLLDKCKATVNDRVIVLGDLLDRGPDSGRCVDIAIRLSVRQGAPACIMGNHENRHLQHQDSFERFGRLPAMPPTHIATRQQLSPAHFAYLRQLPTFIRLPEYNAVAVHAGVFPGRTIEQQSPHHLMHIQCIKPYDTSNNGHVKVNEKTMWPSKVPPHEANEWRFWHHYWDGPERVFFGHSVMNKPLIRPKAVGLDGGCCFGRELWAYVLPDEELVAVRPAGRYNEERADRKLFLIDGDVGTY